MYKIKATKKEMKQNYKILGIGYCDMQYLLYYQKPVAYSCGLYGWSCDYYNINGIIISTGYGYIDTKNMKDDYGLVRKYEQKARELDTAEEVNALLFELLERLEMEE